MNRLTKKITAIVAGIVLGFGVAWAGLETVTHIQDLNSSWPLGSDLASTSDDHIRNIKSALKTDFPNFNGTYTSATAPVFAIPSDTNTGMYSVGADDLGFSTGGTLRFDISTTAFTGTLPWRGQDGTNAAPAYSFSGDTDTGIYRVGANTGGLSAGGTVIAQWNASGIFAFNAFLNDGTLSAPGLAFNSDTDSGWYRPTSNYIAATVGGVFAGGFRNTAGAAQLHMTDGTAAAPAYSFDADSDTGFYRDTANQIGIALGGSTAGQIAQGSFTGTLTGFTANPTGTVNYQRVGKIVTLWITAAITATSNATTMTMTGLPSVIQTGSAVYGAATGITNNGVNGLTGTASVNVGTITFDLRDATAVGFSSSGTKGLTAGWSVTYPIS